MHTPLLTSFLDFLKEELPEYTLHQASFRFLQWKYNDDKTLKKGITIEQGNKAPFEACVTIEGQNFYFYENIHDIIKRIERIVDDTYKR